MTFIEDDDVEVEKKVAVLKERFSGKMAPSEYDNDFTFYRFLKARDLDVDKAEDLLNKDLEWRKENKVETILHQKVISEELEQYFPYTSVGYDKEEAPVRYVAVGNMDVKGLQKAIKFADRMKFFIKIFEKESAIIEEQTRKMGKNIGGIIEILDMKNFSFATATDKHVIEDVIYLARLFQDHYPERLKHVIIINASTYFTIGFAMIKNFLAATIMNKIQIHNSEEQWKDVLLNLIDADVLPAFLGGNKTDPDGDPMCKSFIKHGGPVPEKYFICKSKNSLSKCKDAKKLIIPRAAFNEIELEIEEPGSIIEWEFEIKARDIGFGLFLNELNEDGEEKITELVALMRLDTEEFSETGMFKAEKAGKYVILFDNSYSWVRSKEIYYRAKVVTPKEHESKMTS